MSWTTISTNNVLARLNSAEKVAFKDILQTDGQSDPLTENTTMVTNLVRGYCRAQVSDLPDAGIPPELVDPAVDIIIYKLATRVSHNHAEQRKAGYEAALEILKMVAAGDFVIADDDGASSIPSPSIKNTDGEDPADREFTRDTQDGL
jgi:phage gp36-like protein